jgi:hypothetical protein
VKVRERPVDVATEAPTDRYFLGWDMATACRTQVHSDWDPVQGLCQSGAEWSIGTKVPSDRSSSARDPFGLEEEGVDFARAAADLFRSSLL